MTTDGDPSSILQDLLRDMTTESLTLAGLDAKTLVLVRIAALIASSAPPASYLVNLDQAAEVGLDDDDLRSVLVAVAPIVGTARTVAAVSAMEQSLGLAVAVSGVSGIG